MSVNGRPGLGGPEVVGHRERHANTEILGGNAVNGSQRPLVPTEGFAKGSPKALSTVSVRNASQTVRVDGQFTEAPTLRAMGQVPSRDMRPQRAEVLTRTLAQIQQPTIARRIHSAKGPFEYMIHDARAEEPAVQALWLRFSGGHIYVAAHSAEHGQSLPYQKASLEDVQAIERWLGPIAQAQPQGAEYDPEFGFDHRQIWLLDRSIQLFAVLIEFADQIRYTPADASKKVWRALQTLAEEHAYVPAGFLSVAKSLIGRKPMRLSDLESLAHSDLAKTYPKTAAWLDACSQGWIEGMQASVAFVPDEVQTELSAGPLGAALMGWVQRFAAKPELQLQHSADKISIVIEDRGPSGWEILKEAFGVSKRNPAKPSNPDAAPIAGLFSTIGWLPAPGAIKQAQWLGVNGGQQR